MGALENKKKKWDKVKSLLFPKTIYKKDSDGEKYAVFKGMDANLTAALEDLRDGKNDQAVQDTIQFCINVTTRIRDLLNAHEVFEEGITYVVVDYDEELCLVKKEK